jgi:O-antigen/teichoic acid export membrane protein
LAGMEDRVVRGIRWTVLGYGATRVGSLLTMLVLARLLVPDDFGLVAFGSLLIAAVLLFGTLGLSGAIVIRQDLGREQLRTALALSLVAYAVCAVLIVTISPLAGDLLGQPDASSVLRGLAIPVFFGGVTWFYAAVMQRELQFSRQIVCLAGRVIATAAVAIPLATVGVGVWSLVWGQVGGAAVYTAMLLWLSPYRVRPGFDAEAARALWGSGWGFMLQGGFSFIEQNADYAVIGTKIGAGPLGLYSMAYRIGEVPYNFIVEPVSQATFPGFARLRNRSEDVSGPFLTTLRFTAACAFPLGLIASGAAEPLVEAILGEKWRGMIALLQVLGLWGSLRIVQGAIGWFVNSVGFSGVVGTSYAGLVAVSIPLLIVAAEHDGARGVAWVMVGNIFALTVIVGTIAHRRAGVPARDQWRAIRPSVLATLPAWLAARGVAEAAAAAPAGIAMVASLACGVGAYAGVVWLLDRTLLTDARGQLRRLLSSEERRTGFEPATSSLGSSRSTN